MLEVPSPFGNEVYSSWSDVPYSFGPPTAAGTSPAGGKAMVAGGVLFGVGALATVVTFLLAAPGGTFLVASGPMVFGVVLFVRGLVARNGRP